VWPFAGVVVAGHERSTRPAIADAADSDAGAATVEGGQIGSMRPTPTIAKLWSSTPSVRLAAPDKTAHATDNHDNRSARAVSTERSG